MPYRLIPFTLALLFLPLPLAWADITGQPRVIDGDTIEVAGQRRRGEAWLTDAPCKDR